MESYGAKIVQSTAREAREILGAIGIVFDKEGTTLYHNASGYQSLDLNSPVIDPNSTFVMASASKFITHIASLQCVERGLVNLDDPVCPDLPELENLNILSKVPNGDFILELARKSLFVTSCPTQVELIANPTP
ncbi:hypothetical protein BDZ45DRAFT_748321 [Acephala macrosclerotiorum]|nr:hypothetical protein BDZ45DRAFT_748321 [Acephala macrosclerotiorum]